MSEEAVSGEGWFQRVDDAGNPVGERMPLLDGAAFDFEEEVVSHDGTVLRAWSNWSAPAAFTNIDPALYALLFGFKDAICYQQVDSHGNN